MRKRIIQIGAEKHVMCEGCYLTANLEASKPRSEMPWPEVIGFTDSPCSEKFGCGKRDVSSNQ